MNGANMAKETRRGITYEEAVAILRESDVKIKGEEKLFLHDSLGRILARDVVANEDMPPFPTAAMDGYACRSSDLSEGVPLCVLGDNPAGNPSVLELMPQSCIKTFTGSRMPSGSDRLVIVEDTQEQAGKLYIKNFPPSEGLFIRQRGDNYKAGEVLLKAGTLISPAEIGLLASLNKVFVHVRKKPIVSILSGGNELVELGEERESDNMLRSSNNHMLKALVDSLGGEGRIVDILPDEPASIKDALTLALKESDIVLSTGGMSMGDYDFTQRAIYELCDEVSFHGVKVKPGKPIAYAKKGDTHLFGLPGFPNSCFVTFYLFGRIILNRMLGIAPNIPKLRAKLNEDLKKEAGRAEFRTCTLKLIEGEWQVDFVGKKGIQSSIINNLCGSSALVILEQECVAKSCGEYVDVVLFKPLEAIL